MFVTGGTKLVLFGRPGAVEVNIGEMAEWSSDLPFRNPACQVNLAGERGTVCRSAQYGLAEFDRVGTVFCQQPSHLWQHRAKLRSVSGEFANALGCNLCPPIFSIHLLQNRHGRM